MNFDNLVLEALSDIKVIKRLTGNETMFHRLTSWIGECVKGHGGWLVHKDDKRLLYFYNNHAVLSCINIDHPLGAIDHSSPEDEQVIKDWESKMKFKKAGLSDDLATTATKI